MENLDAKYKVELDSIKGAVQSSDLLETYLESEEDDDYQALRGGFEPQIEKVYEKVVDENPLQLFQLEKELLDSGFEGLYLSKVLGFSVLRGEIDHHYRYKRPQNHFKEVLLAICQSSNFDLIQNRIGQTIQLGFALSSDIWITNLMEQISNKRVIQFLQGYRMDKYRDPDERRILYNSYRRQFRSFNFQSAEFPKTLAGLKTNFSSLKKFLIYRIQNSKNNESLVPHIKSFLNHPEFKGRDEYLGILWVFTMFFDHGDHKEVLSRVFNQERKDVEDFEEKYFNFLQELIESDVDLDKDVDTKILSILDFDYKDDLYTYYKVMDCIHTKGYIHNDTIEMVRGFYDAHEGLSTVNECLRMAILSYFRRLLVNLGEEEYPEYFEFHKTFNIYMGIFDNQKFNQSVKKLSVGYVQKLIKKYTDKRGKDYQEIKKFASATFLDLGFMKEKEVVEFFKTRRKRRTAKT